MISVLLIVLMSQAAEPVKPQDPLAKCRGDLTMVITGLTGNEGRVRFDLNNSGDTFKPQKNRPPAFAEGHAPIKNRRAEYTFKDIPCGGYAVRLYRDANSNQTLDLSVLGVPQEQYGFSNCKGCVLPPSWEKARFLFDKEHPVVVIAL